MPDRCICTHISQLFLDRPIVKFKHLGLIDKGTVHPKINNTYFAS